MIKNKGVIKDKFKTKKFAQRLIPKNGVSQDLILLLLHYLMIMYTFLSPRSFTVREWARFQTFPIGISLQDLEQLVA